MIVPTDHDWHLLAGDASALPAIHRRLEELRRAHVPGCSSKAADERRELASAAGLAVTRGAGSEAWLAALSGLQWPDGAGYAWCAGEASVMAKARAVLLGEKRHPLEQASIAAYWERGAADFHER